MLLQSEQAKDEETRQKNSIQSRQWSAQRWTGFLIPTHPLTSFEIQEYYQNEPKFKVAHSRNNLPKAVKDGAYLVNLNRQKSLQNDWIALYENNNSVTYIDIVRVKHIIKGINTFVCNKSITTNIFRIKFCDSIINRKIQKHKILIFSRQHLVC